MAVELGIRQPVGSEQLHDRLVAIADDQVPDPARGTSSIRTLVEARVGDLCSALGIAGAGVLLASRRAPNLAPMGKRLVMGSVEAAVIDTAIQAHNVATDGGRGAEARGNPRSDLGTVAYAATGLIPAASITALSALRRRPTGREVAAIAAFATNTAVMGYEITTRAPKMADGTENLSGYGSFVAAMGGFVTGQRL